MIESISHSNCLKSHSELESFKSERLSSDSSHSLIVSEMKSALDKFTGGSVERLQIWGS